MNKCLDVDIVEIVNILIACDFMMTVMVCLV